MFTSNSDSEPIAIITNKLYDNEWDFLQFALFSSGLKILFWNSFEGTPYLEKGQVERLVNRCEYCWKVRR